MQFTRLTPEQVATRKVFRTFGVLIAAGVLVAVGVAVLVFFTTREHISKTRGHPRAVQSQTAPVSPQPRPAPSPEFDTWRNPNYSLVGYDAAQRRWQVVAEVIPGGVFPRQLNGVRPYIATWSGLPGGRLNMDIFAMTDASAPVHGRRVAHVAVKLFGLPASDPGFVRIPLRRGVLLRSGVPYSVVFSVSEPTSQVGVGAVDIGDPVPEWQAWTYSPVFGANGEVLDWNSHWQPTKGDLVVKLQLAPTYRPLVIL